MADLNYEDFSWCVALPSTREECRKLMQKFAALGAKFADVPYDVKWKYLMTGKNKISPCIKSQYREEVSIAEAIQRLTNGAKPMSEESTEVGDVKADRLIEVYIKMRDKKAELQRTIKDEVGILDTQMKVIADKLGVMMHEVGTENFKTSKGTAFKATKDRVGVSDIEEFREFLADQAAGDNKPLATEILNNFPWHFLTKAVSKDSVIAYMKDSEGLMPDGLKYDKFIEIQVRK